MEEKQRVETADNSRQSDFRLLEIVITAGYKLFLHAHLVRYGH